MNRCLWVSRGTILQTGRRLCEAQRDSNIVSAPVLKARSISWITHQPTANVLTKQLPYAKTFKLPTGVGYGGYIRVISPCLNAGSSANFSTRKRPRNGETTAFRDVSSKQSNNSDNIDDLKAIWKDSSLSLTAKFKVLFRQYGLVMIIVHTMTAVVWMTLFYIVVSYGFDVVSFLDKYGVYDFLERVGLPASDRLKSPGASNLLSAYLIYEIAKPIRYPVTIFATIYAVRLLRAFKYLKPPPTANATMRELVSTRRKIVRHQITTTTSKYRDRYRVNRLKLRSRLKRNGHYNSKNRSR